MSVPNVTKKWHRVKRVLSGNRIHNSSSDRLDCISRGKSNSHIRSSIHL